MNDLKNDIDIFDEDNEIEIKNKIDSISKLPGKWYVVNCYSGGAEKVVSSLKQKLITNKKMAEEIFDIRYIEEKIKSKRSKKIVTKNLYPGYIFINMKMTDEAWFLVRNTRGVTGFIGSSGKGTKPFPLPKIKAKQLLEKIVTKESATKKTHFATPSFKPRDFIKINGTAFDGQEGQVIGLDNVKGLATVNLEIFSRITPTQIPYDNCEKIS